MKYILVLLLVVSACGKRGSLEPYESENPPYPRQYPQAEPYDPNISEMN